MNEENTPKIYLYEYFGCKCHQIVHINCIRTWNNYKNNNQRTNCIICRKEAPNTNLSFIDKAIISTYAPQIAILQGLNRQIDENEIVRVCKFQYSLIFCLCYSFILCLLGFIVVFIVGLFLL